MPDARAAPAPDPALLSLLVCPRTRTPLRWLPEAGLLVSDAAGLAYPVVDAVPVLLADAARPWIGIAEPPA